MSDLEVRECYLGPMVVVSALGFGTEPETEAWNLIREFAQQHVLSAESGAHRFFGFNNPGPSPGDPNYGYEQWMTIDQSLQVEPPLIRKEIERGRYVATRFVGLQHITDTWREFLGWFDHRGFTTGPDDVCLEELRNPIETSPELWEFDLYLPIPESASI